MRKVSVRLSVVCFFSFFFQGANFPRTSKTLLGLACPPPSLVVTGPGRANRKRGLFLLVLLLLHDYVLVFILHLMFIINLKIINACLKIDDVISCSYS